MTGERWALTCFPATASEVSKTRQQDDTVVIGEVLPWVTQCLPALVKRAQFGKIFLFDLPTYEREMQKTWRPVAWAVSALLTETDMAAHP